MPTLAQKLDLERFRHFTPILLLSCLCLTFGDLLFGYDTASFGGLQANPGFVRAFGELNEATGQYGFTATTRALLTSLAFVGKFIGCAISGTVIERIGHRWTFVALSVLSYFGIVIEITAGFGAAQGGRVAQFIIGRIVVYCAVGMVEVCISTYQSEVTPASLRGFVVSSLQLFLTAGSIIASCVNYSLKTSTTDFGWHLITGLQFIFPAGILIVLPFIPDSPRWLLSKGRSEEATKALRRFRPQAEVAEGRCEEEIAAIQLALDTEVEKGSWFDLVNTPGNRRRTGIILVCYTFQQLTGTQFGGVYQVSFLKQNGYGDKSFLYPIIGSVLGCLSVVVSMVTIDNVGRRPLLMTSGALQAIFLFLVAGLGGNNVSSTAAKNTIVAAFILYGFSYNLAWGGAPYLIGAEVASHSVREKTASVGTALNVFWAWFTSFTIPYMIQGLNFGTAYLFAGLSVAAAVFIFFFLPETKGRALEEVEALFDKPYNPFKPHKPAYDSTRHAITDLENAPEGKVNRDVVDSAKDKGATEMVEDVKK
ncbi:hypothetical protein JCM6882_008160 [Rhodosporidiobolus microsporus]